MGDQMPSASFSNVWNKVKPYLAMVSLQFGYAGMYIISMVSLTRGMNNFILSTYRHVVATIVIAPFAFLLERFLLFILFIFHKRIHTYAYSTLFLSILLCRKIRPKMTLPIFLRIVVLGFLE